LFLPPVVQLIIFGYACSMDVETVRIGWMDGDHTPASRELLDSFTGSGRFLLQATPQHEDGVRELLDQGAIHAAIRILPGFGQDLLGGRATQVQVLIDGANPNVAALVSSYTTQVISRFSAEATAAQQGPQVQARVTSIGILSLRTPRLATQSRVWFNPEL